MFKSKPISMKNYTSLFESYPGMPEPTHFVNEEMRQLKAEIRAEKTNHKARIKTKINDPAAKESYESHCRVMLAQSEAVSQENTIRDKKLLFGERSETDSKQIAMKLRQMGVQEIRAVKFDEDAEFIGIGSLMVTIRDDERIRVRLLEYIDTIARKSGHAGPQNFGQTLFPVRL